MKRWVLLIAVVLFLVSITSVAARVDIVSYCDVTLEKCRTQDQALGLLEEKYVYDLHVEYVFLFDTSDAKKSMTHNALACAGKQGMFDAYKSTIQENLDDLSRDSLVVYADNLGLVLSNFTFCLDTQMTAWEVLDELQEAEEDGASVVPSVRINMDIYTGSQTHTSLEALIKEYLGLDEDDEVAYVEVTVDSDDSTGAQETEDSTDEEPVDEGDTAEDQVEEGSDEMIEAVEEPLFFRVMGQFWGWLVGLGS